MPRWNATAPATSPAAEESWRQVKHPYLVGPSPPLVMAERAAALRADPPADWDGVYVKTSKDASTP